MACFCRISTSFPYWAASDICLMPPGLASSSFSRSLATGLVRTTVRNLGGLRARRVGVEIYDGDPPHHPHGCPAQAWSVAEVCRSWSFVESAEEELPLPDITFPTTPAARIIPTD